MAGGDGTEEKYGRPRGEGRKGQKERERHRSPRKMMMTHQPPAWLTHPARVPILALAVAASQIIEPTGPVMGPNAVADVMPLGGRQEPMVRAPQFLIGLQ